MKIQILRLVGIIFVSLILFAPLNFSRSQEPDPQLESATERAVKMAKRIAPQVAQLRGLEWKREVKTGVYTREMLHELLKKEIDAQKDEYIKISLLMYKLGLVEKGFDLSAATSGLYGGGIAGFYNPETKELNLIGGQEKPLERILQDLLMTAMLGISEDEMTIAHELTHALDDQHFQLMSLHNRNGTSDQEFVRLAVTEGTAVSVQYDFLFQKQGILSYENPALEGMLKKIPSNAIPGVETSNIPEILIKQTLFPYTVGPRLVFEARKRAQGKWDLVNKMFADMPASTEQVLHPEKYLDQPRDMPVVIEQPDVVTLLNGNWAEISKDTFGELLMWLYFENFFQGYRSVETVAREASTGWDGDTLALYQNGQGEVLLTWNTTWDSEKDAEEFFKVYQLILQRKYPTRENIQSKLNTLYQFETPAKTTVRLERKEKDVIIIEGIPTEKVLDLRDLLVSKR